MKYEYIVNTLYNSVVQLKKPSDHFFEEQNYQKSCLMVSSITHTHDYNKRSGVLQIRLKLGSHSKTSLSKIAKVWAGS